MIRIVKLTFNPDKVSDFKEFIAHYRAQIVSFEGCQGVDFLQDKTSPAIFFTYSHWESESALEKYRNSELFHHVWSTVKQWFGDRPQAWSVEKIVW